MKTQNWKLYAGGAVLLLMLATIGQTVFGGSPDDARPADVKKAERVAQPPQAVRDGTPGNSVAGNGVVEPRGRETKVAGAVAGRIASVEVKEGQHIEKDAVLVTLDASVERAALAAAEADLQIANADMSRTLHGQRREDVDAAVEEATAARARAEQSKAAFERVKALAAKGGATPDELDKASAIAAADRASANAVDARMRAAMNGSRPEDVLAAQARAAAARARRDQAKAACDRLVIRAPMSGEALQVRFRAGEYYVPGGADPLVIMGDTSQLTVRMDVDERDVARVMSGANAYVTADAFGDRHFNGRVLEIGRRMGRKNIRTDDPTERRDTKILEVVIELDATDGLVPGQRVVGYIATAN